MAKILYAEDDDRARRAVVRLLEARGHEVTAIKNGMEAHEILKSGIKFDVILSDIEMPKIGGIGLMRKPEAQGIKVRILHSGAISRMIKNKGVIYIPKLGLRPNPVERSIMYMDLVCMVINGEDMSEFITEGRAR